MTKNQEKIKQIAKRLNTVFEIGETLIGLSAVLIAGILIWILIMPKYVAQFHPFFDRQVPLALFSTSSSNPALLYPQTVLALLTGVITMVIGFFTLHQATLIFKDISKAETPFLGSISKHLKRIAQLNFVLSVILPVIMGFLGIVLVANGTVGIDPYGLVFSLIFYGLAYVFDYGQSLQSQADETL